MGQFNGAVPYGFVKNGKRAGKRIKLATGTVAYELRHWKEHGYPSGIAYSCNPTAYFKTPEAQIFHNEVRKMKCAGLGSSEVPVSLEVLDDYSVHKTAAFTAMAEKINLRVVIVKGGFSFMFNPGDRLINKLIQARYKSSYAGWVLQHALVGGVVPTPSRSANAHWAAQALESIPRRTIVRSFVACRVTRPDDYSAVEQKLLA